MDGVDSVSSADGVGGIDGSDPGGDVSAFDGAVNDVLADRTLAGATGRENLPPSSDIPVEGQTGGVGEPGFWESAIPVWGSGRQAIHSFQTGEWGWGLAYTALAVSDVFLVKAAVTAAGKLGIAGITRMVGSDGVERAATEIAEQTARTGADDAAELTANAAARVTGQIAYGATDLSQAAIAFRVANDIRTARNVAVFEYVENGVTRTLAMASERGVGHAERLIARELERMGVDPASVTRIYSELEPCSVLFGGGCTRFIDDTFRNAAVTYSFEYGATAQSRNLGVEQLRGAVNRILAPIELSARACRV
ncbi:MAG: hypothetical protein HC850_03820 [Rhodomicrobium sp.]|nr:hypothetical protein [Rhodomicrobium sp.]